MKRILGVFALAVLGACNYEVDQSTRPVNLVGTYRLVSYGGTVLPATIRADSVVQKVVDGQLVLAADQSWSSTQSVSATLRGTTTLSNITSFGSWSNIREYAYMSFYDKANGYQFSGTASGNTVVLMTASGNELVYRK